MKVRTLLVAAVMFLALSAAAFAQATFSVGSIPVTTVTSSGNTEKAGDVTFSIIQGSSSSLLGTITITYGVPITVPSTAIVINSFGGFAALPPTLVAPFDGASGKIVVAVPGTVVFPASFTVTGVRVQVSGSSLTSLSASVSSTGNAIVAGQTGVTVINAIAPGLAKVGINPGSSTGKAYSAAEVSAIAPVATTGYLSAFENYLDAFGKIPGASLSGGDPTITTGIVIRFTLSAAPPSGVTLNFPATAAATSATSTAAWQLVDADRAALSSQTIKSDSTSLVVYYQLATSSNPTAIDNIVVPVSITIKSSPTLPLSTASITYVASLAPISSAFNSDGTVKASPIPRFDAADIGTGKLLSVVGSSTTLLVPYAVTFTAGGYNTGFAIANTTVDPDEDAIPQTGTITFNLYAQQNGATAPKSYTYTTSATSPGTGLSATGALPAGSTYTVLLSQILSAAGAPADFTGYIIIACNFTNGYAQYVLSNFSTFSQGALALVITGDRAAGTEALNN